MRRNHHVTIAEVEQIWRLEQYIDLSRNHDGRFQGIAHPWIHMLRVDRNGESLAIGNGQSLFLLGGEHTFRDLRLRDWWRYDNEESPIWNEAVWLLSDSRLEFGVVPNQLGNDINPGDSNWPLDPTDPFFLGMRMTTVGRGTLTALGSDWSSLDNPNSAVSRVDFRRIPRVRLTNNSFIPLTGAYSPGQGTGRDGSLRLAHGFTIQWGEAVTISTANFLVQFPIAFNLVQSVTVTPVSQNVLVNVAGIANANFQVRTSIAGVVRWMAIGHINP